MPDKDKQAAVIPANLQAAMDRMNKADTDVDAYPKWDFDKHPILQGTVKKIKTTGQMRRGEEVDVRLAVIETNDETYLLWESANLCEFFDNINVGDEIIVSYRMEVDLGKGRRMKVYDAFYL